MLLVEIVTLKNYMLAEDGKSTVRKKIGASLAGTPIIQRVQSTYVRAPQQPPPTSQKRGSRSRLLLKADSDRSGLTKLRYERVLQIKPGAPFPTRREIDERWLGSGLID